MEPTILLNLDQISPDMHDIEILSYGVVLITDRNNGNSFILIPMSPPKYLTEPDLMYVRKFYTDNRKFTDEEKKLLHSIVISPNQELLEINSAAVLKWYEDVEKIIGPIPTKPTLEYLKNPLYWSNCPVEVTLQTGEVYSFALISQRGPQVQESVGIKRILLKDVTEIRISPFAIPKDVLEAAAKEGIEFHMGDAFYAAEAGGKYYAVDSYYDFRPSSLFFENGNIKGKDLHPIPTGMNESLLPIALFSEPKNYVVVDGLW